MTLKQLEAFYWAATCASFAIAAERLHLSVSSLSKRISELEGGLGLPLFDRRSQRARLTPAGEKLLPRAQSLLQHAQTLRADMAQPAEIEGVCRFGVGELTALTWLPKLVAATRKRYPQLRLEPYVDVGGELRRRVQNGSLDFAVIAGNPTSPAIRALGAARYTWCAAPALVGDSSRIPPDLLHRHPLITLPREAGTTRILDDWLTASGIATAQHLTCNSWGAVAGLLLEGLGVGFLPVSWATALAQRGTLRILRARPALAALPYAFSHRDDDTRPLVDAMYGLARRTVDFGMAVRLL
ncbi:MULTISPECIES: LysR family transcriptional regulator [unclassified Achromobacter]|uniref:LysR substrate-binding domain-containing protein n=1 Tax=unclassified Achromobacter TaxID=2626865 RepID=UPI000B51C817|nr:MULTISPECIES: LysR family transcriptional regulator [unclassified Achromobacter]OWT68144.1 LysR family transcriptional regulator [Achromobacter sp. HZ34]OWT69981.1 LysR family transcriptional regulator [Achromobacter sp. HZ28]